MRVEHHLLRLTRISTVWGITTATGITVRVPRTIRQRPGSKTIVTPMAKGAAPVATRADPALARAFRYQKLLDEGRYASISEMATAERIERGYLGSLLRLTLLAPALVEELMEGRARPGATLPELLQPFSEIWKCQHELLVLS